jgi:hypothetical protein
MRAVPGRIARAPTISAGLLRHVPRDPEAREEGHASHASFGASSGGKSAPSPAAHNGNSIGCLTHDRAHPGPPLRTPGRSQDRLAGKHRHSQEGEP